MNKRETIFSLLKSLSRGEKRAFKIYASRYSKDETNVMVWLFDTIMSQDEYNEKAVKQKLSKLKIKTPFTVLKTKLFQLVLKSLRAYSETNSNVNPLVKINSLVESSNILYQRGLFVDAQKYVDKAFEIAVKFEFLDELIFLCGQKSMIAKKYLPVNEFNNLFKELESQRNVFLDKINNRWKYLKLRQEIVSHYRKYDEPQNTEEISRYNELFNHELLESPDKTKSVFALMNFYNIQTFHYNIIGNNVKALEYAKNLVEVVENHTGVVQYEPDWIFSALNNMLTLAIKLKDDELFNKHLEKLDNVSNQITEFTLFHEKRIFEIKYTLLLSKFIQTNDVEAGLEIVDEIKKGVKKYKPIGLSYDRILRFYFSIALLYYYNAQINEATEWLHKILEIDSDTAITVTCFSRILDVMMHYEIGNYQLLNHKLVNVKRYLKKHNRLLEVEKLVLTTIKRLIKTTDKKLSKDILKELHLQLVEVNKKDKQLPILFYLKIDKWALALLNNQKYYFKDNYKLTA